VSHSQTVINLPGKAMRLAMNPFEPNHAFRVGDCAWGIQFHPEYTADIMRSYILNEKEDLMHEGIEIRPVLDSVKETPVVASILRRFNEFVMMRCGRCK
jgi:GMP synthase (glutamine-hydrolysing)